MKTTLNAKNLETLGAQRLAELLIEISMGSAVNKRRLRLELAGSQGSADVAREVRKRLASIQRARTFIDWRKVKSVKADRETQRRTIVATIAPDDPAEAFDLIWQFLALADSIFERSDDGSGTLIESFHQACRDAGAIAERAAIDKGRLADMVVKAVQTNDYGQFDCMIPSMANALGHNGLERLKVLLVAWSVEPVATPAEVNRKILGWGTAGPIYEDEVYGNHRDLVSRIALQEIADAQGDVDAYIALQPAKTHRASRIATDIATRLTAAGRADEALEALDQVDNTGPAPVPVEWEVARADALDALGRSEDAQAFRWRCFETSLTDAHLRAYLKRLPDFDDMEAEEKALAHVQAFPDVHQALSFFLSWPSLPEAAKLVLRRAGELDGDFYELMTLAADALAEKYPLAATVVLRAMIDFTLEEGRSSRYRHAARHLASCATLADEIESFGDLQPHDAYVEDLKRAHGRKSGFWSMVP